MIELLVNSSGCRQPLATLILAHGAGAPMDSEFMNLLTTALNRQGVDVVRFEFPYMQQRRAGGKKRPPDRQPVLLECWQSVYRQVCEQDSMAKPVLIGGKSMGGRMATLVADTLGAAGACCFGYPFHPPGKPRKLRTGHFSTLSVPTVIIQGARDPFGKPAELENIDLGKRLKLCWLEAGDHDLKPTVRSGFTHLDHIESAARLSAQFARTL